MRIVAGIVLAAASIALPLAVAIAEQLRSPDPGTVFIFTDGRVERFVRAEGDQQIWATRKGREYTRSASPAEPILKWELGSNSGKRTVVGDAVALWPPRPGKKARFRVLTETSSDGRQRRSVELWSCRVGEQEKVAVAAGSYDALPVSCLRYSANTMRPLQQRTWWWSEDIAHYVHRRYENLRNGETSEIRLCAALPENRASAARIDAIVKNDC